MSTITRRDNTLSSACVKARPAVGAAAVASTGLPDRAGRAYPRFASRPEPVWHLYLARRRRAGPSGFGSCRETGGPRG
jgi:hypothetical protein